MNTRFQVVNGKLEIGQADCFCALNPEIAGKERLFKFKDCSACKGSGKKGRGNCQSCNASYNQSCRYQFNYPPAGKLTDHSNFDLIPCRQCNGNWEGTKEGSITDHLPAEIMASFEVKVYGNKTREASWNEEHLALGCLYSCSGLSWKHTTIEKEVESVKKSILNGTQACKVAKDDGTLADHIGIFLNDYGYSVRAVYSLKETATAILNEANAAEVMQNYQRLKKEGIC